ncbi:MAG: tRNA threonylcarbamoyladenosine biosynthesis protein RimN [Oleiphilus sp.]|nr:MAG: tRNA threonylcarbamoyladenosine biosynthesis protein RimN [Oleiphilus sp.]
MWQISLAASLIRTGGVIAYPTESVWGLGCDPGNAQAVERLLNLKDRPVSKGLILVSGNPAHFDPLLCHLDRELQARFLAPTKRPTTWLVPDPEGRVPAWIKGEHPMVAVRVSAHPVVSALTQKLGTALVSTSANPAGRPTADSLLALRRYFGPCGPKGLDYILPGKVAQGAQASMIKHLLTGDIIRE